MELRHSIISGKMKAVQKVMSKASSAVLQENNTEEVQPVSGEVTETSNEGRRGKTGGNTTIRKGCIRSEIKQEEEKQVILSRNRRAQKEKVIPQRECT